MLEEYFVLAQHRNQQGLRVSTDLARVSGPTPTELRTLILDQLGLDYPEVAGFAAPGHDALLAATGSRNERELVRRAQLGSLSVNAEKLRFLRWKPDGDGYVRDSEDAHEELPRASSGSSEVGAAALRLFE
ncbi:hypothetical protein [Nocardioides aestuarii]|uniref:Uncharacterized protein n=1 Tax=Nocardioides aestuarii TaxID=252231 RepID=A0ABW4TTN5_9ACTN